MIDSGPNECSEVLFEAIMGYRRKSDREEGHLSLLTAIVEQARRDAVGKTSDLGTYSETIQEQVRADAIEFLKWVEQPASSTEWKPRARKRGTKIWEHPFVIASVRSGTLIPGSPLQPPHNQH